MCLAWYPDTIKLRYSLDALSLKECFFYFAQYQSVSRQDEKTEDASIMSVQGRQIETLYPGHLYLIATYKEQFYACTRIINSKYKDFHVNMRCSECDLKLRTCCS